MKHYLLGLFFITTGLFAQCPLPSQFGPQWVQGQFGIVGSQVSTQCVGRKVEMLLSPAITNARFIYDYKNQSDTSKATSSIVNVYNAPGPYYIVQIGNINGKPSLACALITVYDTPKPIFSIAGNCENTTATLAIQNNPLYGRYVVDWGDGQPPITYTSTQLPSYNYTNAGIYEIKVKGEGTSNLTGCSAQSNPQTFRANPTPLEITNAFATVDENLRGSVTLLLPTSVKVKNYIFTHNSALTESQANTYIDPLNNVSEQSICYNVSYIDNCDKSPSAAPSVCTIHLKRQDDLTLSWSSASPFIQPVENYTVEVLDSTGKILRTINAGLNTTISLDPDDDPNVSYRIKAINGSQSSFSNTVRVTRSAKLMIPDAFSPNNDQINDTFELRGNYIKQASVKVFDRWGNILFYTDNWKNSWNGTNINGQPMHNGIYTYRIEAIDFNNLTHLKWGMVYLLR